jgi:hypothetical protein
VPANNHPPNTPDKPSGPASGLIQTTYRFNTTATDPDGDPLEYKFDWGDGTISSWGASSRDHSWTSDGTYCVRALARDDALITSNWSDCNNITISENSHIITATAGANGSISPSGSVIVSNGTGRIFIINPDPNYRIADVVVDGISKGAVTFYVFSNVTLNHTIEASFASNNQPPKANAGPDKTVKGGVIVKLSALGSTDPDDGIAGYSWKQTGGKAVTLSNPAIPEPIFVSPGVTGENTTLAFELTVTDKGGLKDTDSCATHVVKSGSIDTDGDGVTDDLDAFPDDPNEWEDTDGDSIGNNADPDDDNDGLSDTDETQKYGTDPLIPDSDGDGYNDGEEISSGTDPLDPDSIPSSLKLETGEIKVDDAWTRVNFKKSFIEPIVVAKSFSMNDKDPGVIRIRNADRTGFDIRIQEWDYLDGQHAAETVSYLVLERGVHTLEDGTRLEADRFETDKTAKFESVSFIQSFQKVPVVISSIVSFNESNAVTGRNRDITTENFEYLLQEQELNRREHLAETVNYIAWEPSSGTIGDITFEVDRPVNKVNHKLRIIKFNPIHASPPVFLIDMQTTNGGDPANIRWRRFSSTVILVNVDEEQSYNREINHNKESVGYMVFSK